MKKLFLTTLCATTIVYGGDEPKILHGSSFGQTKYIEASGQNNEAWPTLKKYIGMEIQHDKLTNELTQKNAMIHFLKTQIRRYRTYSLVSTIMCSAIFYTSVRNPSFFSEKVSNLWKRTPFAKTSNFAKLNEPITQTPVPPVPAMNSEKPKEL